MARRKREPMSEGNFYKIVTVYKSHEHIFVKINEIGLINVNISDI